MKMEDELKQDEIPEAGGEEEEVIHLLLKDYGVQDEKVLDSMLLDEEGHRRSFIPLYVVYRLIIVLPTKPLYLYSLYSLPNPSSYTHCTPYTTSFLFTVLPTRPLYYIPCSPYRTSIQYSVNCHITDLL